MPRALPLEFQAVILASCNDGEDLYPLTERTPLPLLSLANRPLLSLQLEMLERAAGFTEARAEIVATLCAPMSRGCAQSRAAPPHGSAHTPPCVWQVFVIGTEATQPAIAGFLAKYHAGHAGSSKPLRAELIVVPDGCGSADALRQISPRLTTDFVLVAGDTLCDFAFQRLADLHRLHSAAVTALFRERAPRADGAERKKVQAGRIRALRASNQPAPPHALIAGAPRPCFHQRLRLPLRTLKHAGMCAAGARSRRRRLRRPRREVHAPAMPRVRHRLRRRRGVRLAESAARAPAPAGAPPTANPKHEPVCRARVIAPNSHRVPSMTSQIHTDLTDAHVYIFAHWTLSVLADKPHLSSAKFGGTQCEIDVAHAWHAAIRMPSACVRVAELVPYLVRKQFLAQRTLEVPPPSPSAALAKSISRSSINAAGGAPFRCCCFVMPADAGYCTRVTTVPAYLQASLLSCRVVVAAAAVASSSP